MNGERAMTWAALLAKWVELAGAAAALPERGSGARWRRAVAPIIALQAVTHAMGELHELDGAERAVGLDRAEIMLREREHELRLIWSHEALPPPLQELIGDARTAIDAARRRTTAEPADDGG